MNKKSVVLIILLVLVGALLVWGFYSMVRLIIIQYKGSPIAATVLRVDTDCDKYNHIDVVFENKTYSVTISRNDCHNKVYKIGQSVSLLKYKDDDTLVWPQAQYQWLPFMLIAVLALAFYTNKDKFGKHNKPTLNKGLVK